MSPEAGKRLANRYFSAFNKQDVDTLERIIAPALIAQVVDNLAGWVTATCGQYHIEVVHCVAEGNLVSLRVFCVGSRFSTMSYESSTLRHWNVHGSIWLHLCAGKIIDIDELWGIPHSLSQPAKETRYTQSSNQLPIPIKPSGEIYAN